MKKNKNKHNAVVVSLNDNTVEIIQLAASLEYDVVKIFVQQRNIPDVNYYIGSGTVVELQEFLAESKETINLILVDGELKPSQWFNLEKKLNIDVYDRIRLILAIFEQRAERKEARLQVKLAQLQYERPYVRELIHRARAGEHPGLMAGGEYQVDDYYEMIKKQMKKIKKDLGKIRTDREVHRQTRYKSGFYLVSLAGYTNAGKSSLLNLLSGETVTVDGKLFSTLSTTTRRIWSKEKDKQIPILLTDTVGFIENLPPWVIDAFHSTLEEIEVADVVVLVVDASDEKQVVERKLHVSLGDLCDLGVTASIVLALNKIDQLDEQSLDDLINYLGERGLLKEKSYVSLSVKKQKNIDSLHDAIYAALPSMVTMAMQLPVSTESQAFISYLYKTVWVVDIRYAATIDIVIRCNVKIKDRIIATCTSLHGSVAVE